MFGVQLTHHCLDLKLLQLCVLTLTVAIPLHERAYPLAVLDDLPVDLLGFLNSCILDVLLASQLNAFSKPFHFKLPF